MRLYPLSEAAEMLGVSEVFLKKLVTSARDSDRPYIAEGVLDEFIRIVARAERKEK